MLEFGNPQNGKVTVEILDKSGRTVRQLISKNIEAGKQHLCSCFKSADFFLSNYDW